MANKLKKIFSNNEYVHGGKLVFANKQSQEKFFKAIETVYKEGRTVLIDGVSEIKTNLKDGEMEYPFLVQKNIEKVIIGPSVDTIYLDEKVPLNRYFTETEMVLETPKHRAFSIHITFNKKTNNLNFVYDVKLKNAQNIKDAIESCQEVRTVINYLFEPSSMDNDFESVKNMINTLELTYSYLEKIYAIENELNLSFDPGEIKDISVDELTDAEMIYILLIKREPIKTSSKLTLIENSGITIDRQADISSIITGKEILITFSNKMNFTVCGQVISVFTANALLNAIVKKVYKDEKSDKIKMVYDELNEKPMFISYTGFIAEDEMELELSQISKNNNSLKYKNALTIEEYIKKDYQSIL